MIGEILFTIGGILCLFLLCWNIVNMIRYPINSIWKTRWKTRDNFGLVEIHGIIMKRKGIYVQIWVPQLKDSMDVEMDELSKYWTRIE